MSDIPTIEFTITNDHLDTGLRGYPVGTCETSYVDPQEGVSYVGYPIADLAFLPAEDIIHLLFNKSLPTDAERQAVADDIAERSDSNGPGCDLPQARGLGRPDSLRAVARLRQQLRPHAGHARRR